MTQVDKYNVEQEVLTRYQQGAREQQPSLCCPTAYEQNYLDILPKEIIAKDYGCGDPTRYVLEGETVVDLGSGAGKNCYIIAQKVGSSGKVIGVDFNDKMLELARKYQAEISAKLGYANTKFVKAKIQDLQLDLEILSNWLNDHPVTSIEALAQLDGECDRLRQEKPLIPSCSVDLVVSNCVLNLVRPQDKLQLFPEIYRVLKPGGRVVIADIVSNADTTPAILNDPQLWSGCIAGAFREDRFIKMFTEAGFYGIEILERQQQPWRVIEGIEFRSLTIRAFKAESATDLNSQSTIIYRGPWQQVQTDDGQILPRGEVVTVSNSTYQMLTNNQGPYHSDIIVPVSRKCC
ncbi:methyltransferase domain-containing protein [Gloeocapsa sp. PCC 73106]|uniref:methyltransferase domain-containing protein n=1 Tax=Gloeocapsa sp. PCC 73106 TaxID=102232 RepID=UPI0002ABBA04|nr:methyltransferase domain-containing protein [Gloeocapsa sp. PCC 73106]ELS00040.1 methylase involved in ubiquinone/menaquinone biosynthesis [Gloeocapsa sp. PCC 73106]